MKKFLLPVLTLSILFSTSSLSNVIWLEIGTLSQPARNPESGVLSEADLQAFDLKIFDDQSEEIGLVDIAGLDPVGVGYYVGVVNLGSNLPDTVSVKLVSFDDEMAADLGNGLSLVDNFSPFVDPGVHKITAQSLSWQGFSVNSLSVAVTGFGSVSLTGGEFPEFNVVTVTAAPATWYEFIGWTGNVPAASQKSPTVSLTMNIDREIAAVFGIIVPQAWLDDIDLPLKGADDDADSDGFTNRDEYEFGTDPEDDQFTSTATIDIAIGWNLISLAVQPMSNRAMWSLLDNVPIRNVWEWNSWTDKFEINGDTRTKRGYWVYSNTPKNGIVIDGQSVIDAKQFLFQGWNLIGSSTSSVVPANAVFGGSVWYWRPDRQQFIPLPSDEQMTPGLAYWLYLSEDTMIEI